MASSVEELTSRMVAELNMSSSICGGMGVVYRARDITLDRDVAVELLSDRYPTDSPAAHVAFKK